MYLYTMKRETRKRFRTMFHVEQKTKQQHMEKGKKFIVFDENGNTWFRIEFMKEKTIESAAMAVGVSRNQILFNN